MMQKVNNQQKPKPQHQTTVIAQRKEFSGPLPPPEILEKYNSILPGAAERIFVLLERQSNHRQNLESAVVQSNIKDSRIGMWLAFWICIFAIGCGTLCILMGKSVEGSILGGSGILGIFISFLWGTNQKKKEREFKYKEMMNNL
jgi:uncharacterized membrane protein